MCIKYDTNLLKAYLFTLTKSLQKYGPACAYVRIDIEDKIDDVNYFENLEAMCQLNAGRKLNTVGSGDVRTVGIEQ